MSDALASQDTKQSGHAVQDSTGTKVFAGNLAYSVTDESLKALFEPVASEIISAQVIMRGTRSAGYGFVTVKTLEAAQKACELLDKKEFESRQVVIEVAKPTEEKDKERAERRAKRRAGRARGRAPPGEVTEAEASGEVDASPAANADPAVEGDAKSKNKKKKRVNRKKKAAASEAGPDATPAADEKQGETAPTSNQNKPKRKREPRPAGEEPTGEPSKTVVFVANLGFNVDDAGLADFFKTNGIAVVTARIVYRRWGKPRKSKGYGFVDVGSEEEQKKAISTLQGKEVGGREIAIKVAVNAHDNDDDTDAKEKPLTNGTNGKASPEAVVVAQ